MSIVFYFPFLFHISMCPSFKMNNHRINLPLWKIHLGELPTMNTMSNLFMYPRGQCLCILDGCLQIESRPIMNGRSLREGESTCAPWNKSCLGCVLKEKLLCHSDLNLHDFTCRTVFGLSVYAKDSCVYINLNERAHVTAIYTHDGGHRM